MDLPALTAFRTVAAEKGFSRAAQKLRRTQPAVSLAVRRLEAALDETLVDRRARSLRLTDAGTLVLEYARRFANLEAELRAALAELRDKGAGRLVIGANESATLYLLPLVARYRRRYPRVLVQIRRGQASRIPADLIEGELELGVITYEPRDERLTARVIYTDHLAFVVSPRHRLARRASVAIGELGSEVFVAHNVVSPYREVLVREFERRKVPLRREVEVPTVEAIRKLVQRNEGVAFLPRMCVEDEVARGELTEVAVRELRIERKVYLVHPTRRTLSHAARAFLALL